MMYGWRGKILRVDLSGEKCVVKPLDPEVAKDLLGGRGLNAKTLFDEVPPGIDPLGPENVLCLATGTLTATTLGLSSRLQVSTLSPYSGILGDGNVGGSFAHVMKKAGYDQIVVSGKAEKPVYLLIEDDRTQLLDAGDLWGKDVWETTDILTERHGEGTSIACIGQAGENLVRLASTMVDKYASAARGSGAVWGSKNLKAIVVRGTGSARLFDRKQYLALSGEDRKFLQEDKVQQEVAAVYGSHFGMTHWYPGYRNFEKELAPEEVPEQLRPEAWKQYEVKKVGCKGCHIKCKNVYRIPEGERKGELGEGMEYECIYCLGTNCGVEDPVAIMEMENLADIYGVDVIAIGNTIAFAKDLYNRGIIDDSVTGGLSLAWEDHESQIELIHRTVFREGFGNLIAEGMYSMAKIIGKNAMDYCYHVKGLSRGPHPSGLFSLSHAVSSRGADHLRGRSWASGENSTEEILKELVDKEFITEDPVHSITVGEKVTTIADTIGRCKGAVNTWTCAVPLVWKAPLWDGLARLLTLATGIEFTGTMIEETADRIHALERAFNIKQGVTIEHDSIPQKPEIKNSPEGKKEREEHLAMVEEYYRGHGYDPSTGIPTRETLAALGIEYVGDDLEKKGPFEKWDGPRLWPLEKYPSGGKRS